jgi:hypothetical protein
MTFRNMRKNWAFNANPEEASSQATAPAPAEEASADDFSSEPSERSAPEGGDDSNLFSEMTNDFEGGGSEEHSEGEVTPPPTEAEESETPPAPDVSVPPPSSELPESAKVPVTPPPTPVQPEPTAEAPAAPTQPTPEEIQAQLEEHRKTVLPQLQERYKLDEKTVAELESNPGAVIPQLFAQMHYDVTQALFSGVMSQIPQMVTNQMRQTQKQAELESAFYGKYPGLRAHEEVVQQALSAAMQSQLAKSYEEVEQLAATMAAIKLKKPLEELMGQSAPAPSASPVQAPRPSVPQMARPIAPTASGAAIAPQSQGGQKDLWAEMVDFELQQSG